MLLAEHADVTVCCAESRPRCEGAALAVASPTRGSRRASSPMPGSRQPSLAADALLIGADAVGPDAFVNKVGSAALCALANPASACRSTCWPDARSSVSERRICRASRFPSVACT